MFLSLLLTAFLMFPQAEAVDYWPDLAILPSVESPASPDSALLLSVSKYQHVPDIQGAGRNAENWKSWLIEVQGLSGNSVVWLKDSAVTREGIENALFGLRMGQAPSGRLWVVFIGHGAVDEQGKALLVGADAKQNQSSLTRRSFGQEELLIELLKGPQSELVVVIDACFNGQLFGANRSASPSAIVKEPPPGLVILTAGQPSDLAGPLPGVERPAFSYLSLGGMRGWADADQDGQVTAVELLQYSREALNATLQGRSQTPSGYGDLSLTLSSSFEEGPNLTDLRMQLRGSSAAANNVTNSQHQMVKQEWQRVKSFAASRDRFAQEAVRSFVEAYHSKPWPEVDEARLLLSEMELELQIHRSPSGYDQILIKAGAFVMGSPRGQVNRRSDEKEHQVLLNYDFYMGRTEVNQQLYERVMGYNPSCPDYKGMDLIDPQYPVQCVTWRESVKFANALSIREGLPPCYDLNDDIRWPASYACAGYRLPTEAEWEYAAKAGSLNDVWAGVSELDRVCEWANLSDLSAHTRFVGWNSDLLCEDMAPALMPVGSLKANGYGLHDMTGNVWEWVWDYKAGYLSGFVEDPTGPVTGVERVIRGGSWRSWARGARVTARMMEIPEYRDSHIGLRLVRTSY